jgi:hypothetical protein
VDPLEPGIGGVDPHPLERDDRTRRESITAHLLPREPGPLDEQHLEPVPGEVVRGRRASRPGADDEDVDLLGRSRWRARLAHPALILEPL